MNSLNKKLVIVGEENSGKRHLLSTFINNGFPEVYVQNIYDNYAVDIEVYGKKIQLVLNSTVGQENLDHLRHFIYPDTDVIIMCYAIDFPSSLESISSKWYPEVKHYCPDVPIILVGNKKDLREDEKTLAKLAKHNMTTVTIEQGREVATTINAFSYIECSAKNNDGIREVFDHAARASLQQDLSGSNCTCNLI